MVAAIAVDSYSKRTGPKSDSAAKPARDADALVSAAWATSTAADKIEQLIAQSKQMAEQTRKDIARCDSSLEPDPVSDRGLTLLDQALALEHEMLSNGSVRN